MALAGRVFDQFDVPRSYRDLFTSRYFELAVPAQRNHVLAARRGMPVTHATRGCTVQFSSRRRQHFEDIVTVAWGKFGFDLFGMRLPVRPSVEMCYEHTFVFLSPGLRACYERDDGNQQNRYQPH